MFGGTSTFSGFGTPAPTSQPTTSAPLFGAASAPTTSFFGAPKPATPSLFGAPAAPPATPSLFGAPAAPKPVFTGFGAPATSTPAPAGGLFGQAAPAAGGGALFGQQPQQQQQQQPSLFGGLGASGQKPLFGASTPASAATAAPGPAAGPTISKHTKFNDLPDGARTVVEGIDAFIRSQIQILEALKARDLGNEITKTSSLYDQYSAEATAVSNMLAQDSRLAADLRAKLEIDLEDLSRATAIIEGYKNPQAKGAAAKAVANFPFEYFSRKADEFRERLARYKSTMDQIQHQVDSSHSLARNPSAIVPTLRAQNTSFMALASSVAALDLQLKQLKDDYRAIWREKTGSVQDPFKAKSREALERGVEGMEIR